MQSWLVVWWLAVWSWATKPFIVNDGNKVKCLIRCELWWLRGFSAGKDIDFLWQRAHLSYIRLHQVVICVKRRMRDMVPSTPITDDFNEIQWPIGVRINIITCSVVHSFILIMFNWGEVFYCIQHTEMCISSDASWTSLALMAGIQKGQFLPLH